MNRAWSTLEIKAVDDEKGVITGIASTPTTDRMGDIVEPKGAQFKLPIPLLWQHDAGSPIGTVTSARVTDAGIEIKAQIMRGVLPKIDEAWALIKAGLVRGLSIGFTAIESADIKGTWGQRFTKWEWLELSAVTIPANADASIQTIKSIDAELKAASGRVDPPPGATGTPTKPANAGFFSTRAQGKTMPTIQENIASYEAKRNANVAAMQTLVEKSNADGATFDATQKEEYAGLKSEVDAIDSHLIILRDHEKMVVTKATPVLPTAGIKEAPAQGRVNAGDLVIRNNANLPKGMGMARYVKALAFGKGNHQQALEYAKQWDDSTPEVSMALKTAVAGGTTTDTNWALPLVYNANLTSEFVSFLRPQTIIGKINGLRQVPFNVRFPTQSSGSTVGWVGEAAAKPVSKLQFSSSSLGFAKAAGIVVITQELARFSSPSAELLVRDDLTAQMVYFLDQQFIDPSIAAVANTNPASILNLASNVRQAAAAWTSMANVLTDVKVFLSTFAANEISLENSYWIMTPDSAMSLGLIMNTGGTAFAFPGIDVNGGTFLGLPVIVSNSVPHSTSAGAIVALVKASEVFLADDGQVAIDVSQEASLQMDSAPSQTSATPTASTVVSMFQTNSIAIRAERIINWARRRSYGVGYIDNMHTS